VSPEPERWRRFVGARLGAAVRLQPASNPDGEALVWRVDVDDGATAGREPRAFLKLHRTADKWRRERTILERLAEPPAAPVPVVLAAEPEGHALLLGARPGVLASSQSWSQPDERSLHEQAGRLRRRLDAVAVDDPDPLPLPEAMQRRLRAWLERARPTVAEPLRRAVEASFDPGCFEGATRRWSHRDLAPHNWIVEPGPHLAVIDFGQARPDVWLVDVLKLWDGPWVHDPTLADAFWRGYGRRPSPIEETQLRALALVHGLATAAWGDRHGHASLSAHGRVVLTRALALDPLPRSTAP
jgi:Ser/Thr protein kinase RdoA (MazF antagonist)